MTNLLKFIVVLSLSVTFLNAESTQERKQT